MHHIIGDRVSVENLFSELSVLYQAYTDQTQNKLAELTYDYLDFAVWQQTAAENGELEQQIQFWLDHLIDAPSLLQLPSDGCPLRPMAAAAASEKALHDNWLLQPRTAARIDQQ